MKRSSKLWLKIHFYSGLVSALYLLIIGVSAFHYNHHLKFLMPKEREYKVWQKEVSFTDTVYNNEVLQNINKEIGIFGHLPWWEQHTDSLGNFHYTTNRPGKKYRIVIPHNSNQVIVNENNNGIGTIITGLHVGSSGGPKSEIMTVWHIFADIAIVLAFIVIISSFLLWYKRSFKKRSQWTIVFIIGGLTLFYIFYIWLVG